MKKTALLLTFLFITLFSYSQGVTRGELLSLFYKAQRAERNNNTQEALEIYKNLLSIAPNMPMPYLKLADIYAADENNPNSIASAITLYKKYLELNHEDKDADILINKIVQLESKLNENGQSVDLQHGNSIIDDIIAQDELSLFSQEQVNNCILVEQAKEHIKNAIDILERADSENDYLEAAYEYELALIDNSYCEELYMELADTYKCAGIAASEYNSRHFIKARAYLEELFAFCTDPDYLSEADELLSEIFSKEKETQDNFFSYLDSKDELERRKESTTYDLEIAEELEKKAKKIRNRDNGFWSFAAGYGPSYGQLGLKTSIVTAPKIMILTGGIGYPTEYFFDNDRTVPLLWSVGVGWSIGNYYNNFQLMPQYGKIRVGKNTYKNTGGITVAANFDLFSSKFGVNLDAGYWITDTSKYGAVFAFSAGLYYKICFGCY
jgi:hypothetical protein